MMNLFLQFIKALTISAIQALAFNGLLFWLFSILDFSPVLMPGTTLLDLLSGGLLAFGLFCSLYVRAHFKFMKSYQQWEDDFLSNSPKSNNYNG